MTAADHLARAEKYLSAATEDARDDFPAGETNCLMYGMLHVLCAIAIEMGVPPVAASAGGGGGG